MPDNILQINWIKQLLAIKSIELGVAQIRQNADISTKKDGSAILTTAMALIPPVLLDSIYYYTSYANWQTIINLLNDITKIFPWEAERFDCDKRANLVACLCSLLFKLNTCGTIYCEIFSLTGTEKYYHYINFIVDDQGVPYIWDADNGGLVQKLTGQDMVMGQTKYHFLSSRTI
jgi:hypothetical protein